MPDSDPIRRDGPIHMRDALRALPVERPEASRWPLLSARMRRQPRRRPLAWLALAAGVALAAVALPRLLQVPGPVDPPPAEQVQVPRGPAALDALIERSSRLERQLASGPGALRSGAAVLASDWILGDIAALDARLGETPAAPEAEALWRQRVELLDTLADLQQAEQLAAAGSPAIEPGLPLLD